MKKVIKSRIFLVIITMIICISGTLYAANTYKATDVVYNASDGTSMNVNEALNELYNKESSGVEMTIIDTIDKIEVTSSSKPSYTYDIKKLTDNYANLTQNNFFTEFSGIEGVTSSNTWANTAVSIEKKYDSNTGILTISINYWTSAGGYCVRISGLAIYMIK